MGKKQLEDLETFLKEPCVRTELTRFQLGSMEFVNTVMNLGVLSSSAERSSAFQVICRNIGLDSVSEQKSQYAKERIWITLCEGSVSGVEFVCS
jgi:hypothetical protein